MNNDRSELAHVDKNPRARVLATSERWVEAIAALRVVIARDPKQLQALRLRADVLSWSGQHAEAIAAYDTYLGLAPLDLDARRQQARVAGWAGQVGDAHRRYAALVASFPDSRVLTAEASAQTTISATRTLSDQFSGLRAIGWAEQLAYRDRAPDYFSPSAFLHVDGGLEYAHAFSRPRFQGDRERMVAGGYLIGIDTRGTPYQQPFARLSFELTSGLMLDGRAGRIQSADYHQTTFSFGLRLGGASFVRQ
jgi:tetratricopeptide (TPR) repeat protein